MEKTSELSLSKSLSPLCPRDNHVMKFEKAGILWKDEQGSDQTLSSYHCGYFGCSVRYDPQQGYYTIIEEPDLPYFVEEPGVNLSRCPIHDTWLYKARDHHENSRLIWRCGVEGCTYSKNAGSTA